MVSHNSFQPEKKGKNNQENIRNARGSPIQTICALLELNPRKREIPLKKPPQRQMSKRGRTGSSRRICNAESWEWDSPYGNRNVPSIEGWKKVRQAEAVVAQAFIQRYDCQIQILLPGSTSGNTYKTIVL